MRILYISQYFYPEIGATTNRAVANIKHLVKNGHKVTILTEIPNHPQGKIFKGYKGKFFCHEKINGYDILRTYVYTTPKKNFFTRTLFYSTFMVFGIITAVLNWRWFDIVYVSSPPLFVGGIGIVIKKLFPHTRFIFEVRDLWPDVAIEIGELKNRTFMKLSSKLAMYCYSLSDKIISVTEYYKEEIINKGIPGNKIFIVRNGTDINNWKKCEQKNLQDNYHFYNKFIAIYAGNLGLAQGIDTILYAAKELKEEKDILFLIIGDGPEKEKLYSLYNKFSLENVAFLDSKPPHEISKYLSTAHCGIVPLKKSKAFCGTIPSKLFDYLACELPILLGVDGEARKILEESNAGLFYEPENYMDLANKIIMLKNNYDLEKLGRQGRCFVEKFYNRQILAKSIEKIVNNE